MSRRATKAVILAAGQGKRMGSDLPKVLHPVDGKPMVIHCIEATMAAGIDDVILVVGVGRDEVIGAWTTPTTASSTPSRTSSWAPGTR